MIKIVGLGPGAPEALTIGAVRALEESDNLYFRTEKHPTVDYLKGKLKSFNTCDNFYEEGSNFDEVYSNIANNIVKRYRETEELVYAVPGHPLVAERSVTNIIDICNENNIKYEILPAVSFIDAMMDRLEIDPIEGLKIIDAFDIGNQILDKRIGTIITQVYNGLIASEVKLKLLDYYNDETEIYFVRAAGIEGQESIRKIPIYELDMQEDIDYLTSVYIPKDNKNKKDFYDLINIIEELRSENGCPWDRVQTHESIKGQLIEECYEVVDAIEKDDIDGLIEELGDVLLHVVFHSVIGNEDGYFNISDIINAITTKMIYRHPHVFKIEKSITTEEVLDNWDELKKKEKNFETLTEEINAIANALPALVRAKKVQKKAAKVGFDFENINEAVDKLREELNEVLDVYETDNKAKILEEVGDLIFSCVNIARMLDVDSEEALTSSTKKFINRFEYIENKVINSGKKITEVSIDEMNAIWEEAKEK